MLEVCAGGHTFIQVDAPRQKQFSRMLVAVCRLAAFMCIGSDGTRAFLFGWHGECGTGAGDSGTHGLTSYSF